MVVTPRPIRIALLRRGMIPVHIGAMLLLPVHMVGAIFVRVPLMIVLVLAIIIALIAVVIVILSQDDARR